MGKKITFGILFFGFGIFSNAQSSLPKNVSDSLWAVWINEDQPDSLRLNAIHKFAWNGYVRNQPDSAFFYAQLQYDFALERNMKFHMGIALNTQGAALDNKGDYLQAIEYYNRSLKIREEIGDRKGMAASLNNIGLIHFNQSQYDQAYHYHILSLTISTELGDKAGMALSFNNIGAIYQQQGEFIKALEYFITSLKIREEISDLKGMASTLNNLALVYFYLGDYAKALEYHAQGLKIKEKNGDKRGMAISLSNIAIIYTNQGDYAKGLEFHTLSLKIREEIKDKKGIATSLNNLGAIYHDLNDHERAKEYYLQSLKIREEIGDQNGIAIVFNNLGFVYKNENNPAMALEYFLLSLKVREEIGDKLGATIVLNGIGQLFHNELHDYELAIDYSLKALNIAVEIKANREIRRALISLYGNYIRVDRTSESYILLSQIIQIRNQNLQNNFFSLTEHEKQIYFSTMEEDYGLYFDFTLHYKNQFHNLSDTCYNIALYTKGITLKSSTAMRQFIQNSNDSLLIRQYENWLMLKKQITKSFESGNDTKTLEEEANLIERELAKKSNAFNDFDKMNDLDWKAVRDGLKTEECAIEFVHFRSEIDTAHPIIYMALLIRSESEHPEVIRLCNESDLVEILGTFQGNNFNFVNSVYGTKKEAKSALYEKIWQPLEPFLENIKTVYYSPSGLLHKVSFASISKTQNVFLSDVYNFRQMGSTGNMALSENTGFGELENFLLMGGIKYNSDTTEKKIWNYLPGSLAETESINSYLQKKKLGVNYFKESNASEAAFKEKIVSSSIVHIATHGFFFPDPDAVRAEMNTDAESNQELNFRGTTNYANWSFVNNKNPLMRSGIVLSGANDVWSRDPLADGEDGILTAQEVSNLDLRNTKLVVLSACETGLGDIKGSEGVFGLQRAFKMAGVKYLIMSLWQVPDKETAEFMILFYKNLIKIKDIPLAFQKTQKVMRKKYDPYYWGAFVLIE